MSRDATTESDSSDDHSNGPSMRRRELVALAGASSIAALGAFNARANPSDRTELVVTRSADGPGVTATVPREWYDQVLRTERVADRLKRTLLDDPGVASVGIGRGDAAIAGLRTKAIEVGLRGDEARANIPDQVDDVQVNVTRNVSPEFDCYGGYYSSLRGGISADTDDDGNGEASLCCRIWDNGWKILTARHLLTGTGNPCGSLSNTLYRNGSPIGTVKDSAVRYDALWLEPDDDDTVTDDIVDESTDVAGWVTQDGLRMHASDGTTHHLRAATTCSEDCTVEKYDQTLSLPCDTMEAVVHYNGTSQGGDSGGIRYFNADGKAWVTGINSGHLDSSTAFGSAAYAIQNNTDVQDFD